MYSHKKDWLPDYLLDNNCLAIRWKFYGIIIFVKSRSTEIMIESNFLLKMYEL